MVTEPQPPHDSPAADRPAAPVTVSERAIAAARSTAMANHHIETPPPAAGLPPPMVEPIDPPTSAPDGSVLTRALLKPGTSAVVSPTPEREPHSAMTVPETPRPTAEKPAPKSDTTPPAKAAGPDFSTVHATTKQQPRLVVVRGEKLNVEFVVLEGKNYVGRTADRPVDIDLDGQEPVERIWTSRQHACLTLDRGVLTVEDLTSLNGTFVNRVRLHPSQPKPVQAGDVVQIGTVQLKVVM